MASSYVYARNCYNQSADAQSLPVCQSFTQSNISYTTTLDAGCPFNESTCQSKSANLLFDTGLLDSNTVLGVNTRVDNIQVRKQVTCAPILPYAFSDSFNYSAGP